MNQDHIRRYWEAQGQAHPDSHHASWGDNWMIDLEIRTIARHIPAGGAVLEAGCSNGHATFRLFDECRPARMVGFDFAQSMVDAARAALARRSSQAGLSFASGDVRALSFPDASFDMAFTTRVLINLPTWDEQRQAIGELLRVVKPGGTVVLSEGFWEPLMRLNAMRALVNLPPLVEHDFNRYLKRDMLIRHLAAIGKQHHIEDFSSIYYLGSRFLRELVTDPSAHPGYSNPINRIFHDIELDYSGGGLGIQQAVVIRV